MSRRALAPLAYLLLAALAHLPALSRLTTATSCACRDAPQTDWFLAWTPHAVATGRAPWTTDALNVPDGVNLLWNTLLPLPGLLAAPVTATLGVLAAHTLLSVAAFAGSATAMWWVAGRWAPWGGARFAAGLLYGTSPYLVAQGTGHLNLTLVALPPLVLLLADELLVRQRRSAVGAGALLGLVATAQFLTTTEVLASTFVVAVLGLLVLGVQRRGDLTAGRVRHAAVGLGTAALLLTALVAWPLAVQFAGPQALSGDAQDTSRYAADLLGVVVPTVHQVLGTDATLTWGGNDSENGSYLGLPLLLLLAVVVVRLRRVPVVRWAAVTAVLVWVLSLGERLHVGGTAYDVPLPFALLSSLPVLESLVAVRLSLYDALLAGLLLAVGLDRWHAAGAPRPRAAALVAVLVVLPLVPVWPYDAVDARTPAYFTSDAVERVPEGSVALTFPVPRFPTSAPMLWQAEAGFRYRSVGGYVITPDADGSGTFAGGVTAWERVVSQAPGGRLGTLPPQVVAALRAELADLDVSSVLVADVPGAPAVVRATTQLLGPPDETTGGVTAWYDVPDRLR